MTDSDFQTLLGYYNTNYTIVVYDYDYFDFYHKITNPIPYNLATTTLSSFYYGFSGV